MRIALVTEFYYPHPGGVTEHVHHLAGFLATRGHDVRIITSHVEDAPRRPDRESSSPRVEVLRIGTGVPIAANGSQARVTVGFGLERKMMNALWGCDLVHVHSPLFPVLPYLALKAARRAGLPSVGTFHTHFQSTRALATFGGFMQGYARALDRAIAVSPSAARSVRRFFGDGTLECEVIPNGVDTAAWASGRATFSELPNIVFLGRLDPRNDVEVLLAAFARLRGARLTIVGDGPRRAQLESLAPPGVRFVGAHDSLAARANLLASAQVMAFTARIVSHPMALLEGLAAGLPAVAYDIEGVRELVMEGRQGYKVPVGDAGALAEALARVLADEPRRRMMARQARATAARYDWQKVGARILEVYRAAAGFAVEKGAA